MSKSRQEKPTGFGWNLLPLQGRANTLLIKPTVMSNAMPKANYAMSFTKGLEHDEGDVENMITLEL